MNIKELVLKTKLENANEARKIINKLKLIDKKRKYAKDKKNMYFPILEEKKELEKIGEIINKKLELKKEKLTFEEKLQKILTKKELEIVKTGRDNIGSITILEIPCELDFKEEKIANALLQTEKTVKTVLKKKNAHLGIFRTQKYECIAGENTRTTIYKENNIKIKINVETVYFSVRLSTERKRISEQVRKGEEILVMFSGAAPYPCVLAKNTRAKKIVGIELNKEGHEYGLENLKLNKIKNVELYNDDAINAKKLTGQTFDRIIMPLPKDSPLFIESALDCSKKGTIIHLYYFTEEKNIKSEGEKLEEKYCWKLLNTIKAGQHSPRKYRICYEFEVL